MRYLIVLIIGVCACYYLYKELPAALHLDGSSPPAGPRGGRQFVQPIDIKFTAVDGRPVDVSKMRGKVVLVDFWATWCGPCMQEVPDVVATYRTFHPKGFEIVGISLDQSKQELLNVTMARAGAMTLPGDTESRLSPACG